MKISIYFKDLIEQLWQHDKKQAALDQKTAQVCLRCGKPLDPRMAINALSRHANVYICQECGTDEALLDAFGEPLPLRDWHAMTSGRIGLLSPAAPSLMPVCTFEHIFEGEKNGSLSAQTNIRPVMQPTPGRTMTGINGGAPGSAAMVCSWKKP